MYLNLCSMTSLRIDPVEGNDTFAVIWRFSTCADASRKYTGTADKAALTSLIESVNAADGGETKHAISVTDVSKRDGSMLDDSVTVHSDSDVIEFRISEADRPQLVAGLQQLLAA